MLTNMSSLDPLLLLVFALSLDTRYRYCLQTLTVLVEGSSIGSGISDMELVWKAAPPSLLKVAVAAVRQHEQGIAASQSRRVSAKKSLAVLADPGVSGEVIFFLVPETS